MTILAILTAIVVVLQLLGAFIRFGIFSISLVLVPIIIGAAICGPYSGAWLGCVFGVAVLLSGDAAAFLAIDPFGTVITVFVKGTLAGLLSGIVYKYAGRLTRVWAEKRAPSGKESTDKFFNLLFKYLPVVLAAIACPVVNTGIFLIGCRLFFYATIAEWGSALGFANAAEYMFLGLAGGNFLFELGTNIILTPVITRLLSINKKIFKFDHA